MAEPIETRVWRERTNALGEYVLHRFLAPVNEGYRECPVAVLEAAGAVGAALDALDDALCKIDRRRPVGGELVLREEWLGSEPEGEKDG